MREARYFYVPNAAHQTELPSEETVHALRVLRLKGGDELFLMDGVGNYYRAQVTLADSHHCFYEIQETLPQQRQWTGKVHLAIAPTKMMERMEWLAEKATEIGIDELSFLDCQFSERRIVKLPRMEKIVVAAVKQSRKAWMPRLNALMPFRDFVSQPIAGRRYIAHCYDEIPRQDLFGLLREPSATDDATVLIGPEGDFSIDEVQLAISLGFESVHLGQSRFRTETAGLASVMMMQLAKGTVIGN